MRLLVSVTHAQKDSQLLWRPLRIAVDIREKKTEKPVSESGDWWSKPMETYAAYRLFQYSEAGLK